MPASEPQAAAQGHCSLIILDDFSDEMYKKQTAETIMLYMKIFSHHKNLVVFYITQNVYDSNKYHRTLSLNSNYLVLFRNLCDQQQIKRLAQQIYGDKSKIVMTIYNKVMHSPHKHILLDLHPCSPHPLAIFTNVLPSDSILYEDLQKVFVPRPI